MQRQQKTLVTFDVDGTLCVTSGKKGHAAPNANKLHSSAFNHAFKTVFGVDAQIDEIPHSGSTDQLILVAVSSDIFSVVKNGASYAEKIWPPCMGPARPFLCGKVLLHRGFSQGEIVEKLPDLMAAMISYAQENRHLGAEGLQLLPGVEETLRELRARDDVVVGLVTGNLEPIAWNKMECLGIRHYFTEPAFGGFGSDFCSFDPAQKASDRAELVRRAAKRAQSLYADVEFSHRFHVGDAPPDIEAAESAGAIAIGVTTGIFSHEDLSPFAKSERSVILSGMHDSNAFLNALGLAPLSQ